MTKEAGLLYCHCSAQTGKNYPLCDEKVKEHERGFTYLYMQNMQASAVIYNVNMPTVLFI